MSAFDASGMLVHFGQDKNKVEQIGKERGASDFGLVSVDPATEEWTRTQTTFATYPVPADDDQIS